MLNYKQKYSIMKKISNIRIELIMHKKRKFGFSIAEALMALLVVSLITMAAVPVITKKKRDTSQGVHGEWMCYLNNAGQHVTRMTANGKTTTSTGSSCTFAPPGRAQNFSVKVVGGGGGGAAGTRPTTKTFYSTTTYRPDKNGDYTVAVIGGGGGGGQIRCGSQARTGGTGGWNIQDVALRTDKTCTIQIGKGGEGNCGHNSKARSRVDGKTTSFICAGYTVQATGGEVGDSRDTDASDCDWKGWSSGKGGQPNGQSYIQTGVLSKYNTLNTNSQLALYIPGYKAYGRGGAVGNESGTSCKAGSGGAVGIIRKNTSGGGAGSPGASVVKTFPKLNVVRVTIGRGGTGGRSNGANGTQGGTTSFGNIVTALGGNAGEADFTTGSATASKGENATTPSITNVNDIQRSFGGLTENNSSVNATAAGGYSYNGIDGAGSGGAGGGATWSNTGGSFGQGADGRSGLVVVSW